MSTASLPPAASLPITSLDLLARRFFLPVDVLSRVFRGKFVAGLRSAFHARRAPVPRQLLASANRSAFSAWLRILFRNDWVVYSKRPFGGPEHVLRYLGAYTHRVAISNHRLVALADGNVTFRWRDSAHGNKKRLMTLPVDEFLRRFLLHLLPPGFVRIRTSASSPIAAAPICCPSASSYWNHRCARHSLEPVTVQPRDQALLEVSSLRWNHALVERLTAAQMLRSPPLSAQVAA